MERIIRKHNWSIRTRLILLVLLATLPALGIILHNGLTRRQEAIANAELNLQRLVESLASLQVTLTTSTRQMLMTLAELPELRTLQAPRLNPLFAEILKHNPFYNTLAAATPQGRLFTAGVPFAEIDISDRKYFQEALATKGFAVGEFAISRTTQLPTLHFAYPVLNEAGQIQAVLLIGFNLQHYHRFLKSIHLVSGSVVGIADHQGFYLFRYPTLSEDNADLVGKTIPVTHKQEFFGPSSQGSFIAKGLDGIERLYSFKQLHLIAHKDPYLYLWVGIQAQQVLDQANLELRRNLVLLGLATLLALLGAWHLGNLTVVNRLHKLVQAARLLGGGDLQTRTHLPYNSGGELGLLAQSFDDMAVKLERHQQKSRLSEEKIEQQREFLEKVLDSLTHPFYVVDANNYQIVLANQAAKEKWPEGFTTCYELTHQRSTPCDDLQHTCPLQQVRQTGQPVMLEHVHFDEEMGPRYVDVYGYPIFDAAGRVVQMLEYTIDITERRQAEEALKTLVEKSPMGIFIIQQGKFVMVNPGFQEITGYSADDLLGQNALKLVVPEFKAQVRQQAAKMLKGKRHLPYEYQFVNKHGEIRWAMEKVASTEVSGKLATLGYFVDVTERNRLEEQVAQLQRVEAIAVLAGGVAHDFNNLLTAIMAHGEIMLMEQSPDHPIYSHVEDILKAAKRGESLTHQLLAFSRKQVLQPRVFNLNEAVAEMEKMLRRLIGEDIELISVLEEHLGLVKADPGQVEQIIMNLAVNARDAMPRGGKLTLETANVYLDHEYAQSHPAVAPGPYVMLAVSDTGLGMDAQTQSRIFEPFFTTKELGRGTGLGLATVYGIVKQSGGYIWVYSEMGQGTTFKVYFPQVTAELGLIKKPEPIRHDAPQGQETILVVEDDELLRTIISRALSRFGYQVLAAAHGAEALETVEHSAAAIHLLITDVVMPHLNGPELAARLTALYPEMKVLYMSGYTDNAIVHHGVLDHALWFLQKPFPITTLLQKVREVLDAPPTT